MVRSALIAVVACGLCATPAPAAHGSVEGVPAGPPACTVVARAAPPSALGVDLWVQCNYRVSEMGVKIGNRRISYMPSSPELFGGGEGDSISCRRSAPHRAACHGRVPALARVHARLTVDESVCRKPRMRLAVSTFGGPECTGNCPGIGLSDLTLGATSPRRMGCFGS